MRRGEDLVMYLFPIQRTTLLPIGPLDWGPSSCQASYYKEQLKSGTYG